MKCRLRLAYVFLVMTVGEAEGPFQTANLIKVVETRRLANFKQATIDNAVAERPDRMRQFQLDDMEDFDDILWWTRTSILVLFYIILVLYILYCLAARVFFFFLLTSLIKVSFKIKIHTSLKPGSRQTVRPVQERLRASD